MARRLSSIILWLISVAILAVVVVELGGRWEAVGDVGGLPGIRESIAAVALFTVANGLLAYAWREVLAVTGRPIPLRTAAWVWSASQLSRYLVGSAQIAGRAVMARRHGLTATAGAATALLELGWMMSITAALTIVTLPSWLPGAEAYRWLAWAAAAPIAGLIVGLIRPEMLIRAVGRLVEWKPIERITGGRLAGVAARLAVTPAQALRLTGLYALNVALRLAAFLILFAAVGGDVRQYGLVAVGASSAGRLIGWLAVFAPGGLGPREGVTVLVVGPVLGLGPAAVLTAAVRVLEFAAELVLVAVARLFRPDAAAGGPASEASGARDG